MTNCNCQIITTPYSGSKLKNANFSVMCLLFLYTFYPKGDPFKTILK